MRFEYVFILVDTLEKLLFRIFDNQNLDSPKIITLPIHEKRHPLPPPLPPWKR